MRFAGILSQESLAFPVFMTQPERKTKRYSDHSRPRPEILPSAKRFDATLKKKILSENQRFPRVTISGNEVRLTYSPEMEWTKDSAFDRSAKGLALECLETDYAALKGDPRHRLHDYFHVIEYSTWSHQIIGEARPLMRAGGASAGAVDAAETKRIKESRTSAGLTEAYIEPGWRIIATVLAMGDDITINTFHRQFSL